MTSQPEQAQLGASLEGTVVLDIGGDVGALVLHTGQELLLAEIEVSRVDGAAPLAEGFGLDGAASAEHGHSHGPNTHDHVHASGHEHAGKRTHVAVRERRGGGAPRYAAIYDGLYNGDYVLWRPDGTPGETVTIVGGQVSEVDWR